MSSCPSTCRARTLWSWFLARRVAPVAVLGVLLVAGYFVFWRLHLKRFRAVREGVLYRVGQPTEFGLRHLVQQHHVKTVLSIRLEDPPLHRGLYDAGQPDGEPESTYVRRLGARHLQWPLGEETYWPWVTPWHFEEFYKLFDDPANLPVAVHCLGGRHRTGTFVALFELEYNRRPTEEVLAEMHACDFGAIAWLQDHNLRTYWPRPRPSGQRWQAFVKALHRDDLWHRGDNPPESDDYESLVRRIRTGQSDAAIVKRLQDCLRRGDPMALCLAQRLIDTADHPLAELATRSASEHLQADADPVTWAVAAALIADFGMPEQQQALYELLSSEPHNGSPSPRYQAVVAGVTNRYTPNRIAYLWPLLSDVRQRPEPQAGGYRYCDTAVARLTSITNEPIFIESEPMREAWNQGVTKAERWFDEHPEQRQLTRLQPPSGRNVVRAQPIDERDGRNWAR